MRFILKNIVFTALCFVEPNTGPARSILAGLDKKNQLERSPTPKNPIIMHNDKSSVTIIPYYFSRVI